MRPKHREFPCPISTECSWNPGISVSLAPVLVYIVLLCWLKWKLFARDHGRSSCILSLLVHSRPDWILQSRVLGKHWPHPPVRAARCKQRSRGCRLWCQSVWMNNRSYNKKTSRFLPSYKSWTRDWKEASRWEHSWRVIEFLSLLWKFTNCKVLSQLRLLWFADS